MGRIKQQGEEGLGKNQQALSPTALPFILLSILQKQDAPNVFLASIPKAK